MSPLSGIFLLISGVASVLSLILIVILSRSRRASAKRADVIPPREERVLILGASSGVGRELALKYASRGARVCIVGRREPELLAVKVECQRNALRVDRSRRVRFASDEPQFIEDEKKAREIISDRIVSYVGDFSDVENMCELRDTIVRGWNGLDTLAIIAGVSTVLPLMQVASSSTDSGPGEPLEGTPEGLLNLREISQKSLNANSIGPMLSACAFIPLIESTSHSPSILLLSSVASVIPAPTRSLYSATKSFSLLLFQSLAIEHPRISFSIVLPASIEGDFRSGAVDLPKLSQVNASTPGLGKKLKREAVAGRCILAVDNRERTVWMPGWYRVAHFLYWLWPGVIERGARRKYGIS